MYDGTEIPSGVSMDITNLEFFGIINIARAYFHLSMSPFVVECHIYIDPFGFYIGDFEVLSIKGLEGSSRRETQMKKAKEERDRAEREEQARIDAMNKEKAKKCDTQPCWPCAEASAGNPIELCAGNNVVSMSCRRCTPPLSLSPYGLLELLPASVSLRKRRSMWRTPCACPQRRQRRCCLSSATGKGVSRHSSMLFGTAPGSAARRR